MMPDGDKRDDRLDTTELELGEVSVTALAREVRGLRDDLNAYRRRLELRLRRRTVWTMVAAAMLAMLVAAVLGAGIYVNRLEQRVAARTLAEAVAASCDELRQLDAILVTFLEERRAEASSGGAVDAIDGLIERLENDPCPTPPEVSP